MCNIMCVLINFLMPIRTWVLWERQLGSHEIVRMCPFGISGFKRKGKTAVGYCQDVCATMLPTGIS